MIKISENVKVDSDKYRPEECYQIFYITEGLLIYSIYSSRDFSQSIYEFTNTLNPLSRRHPTCVLFVDKNENIGGKSDL